MKKLSLLVGGIILSGAVLAQKPAADVPMTLEGVLGINAGATGGTNLSFTAPAIRFRYFITDNIAARVTFGIANTMNKQDVFENPDYTGGTGDYKITTNGWNASVGAEYHFAGTDRLSPFGALNIMFGGGSNHFTGTNATNPSGTPGAATYVADHTEDGKTGFSTFGVGLSAGVDYYFAENFYAGLELGIAWMSQHDRDGDFSITDAGTTTSTTVPAQNSMMSITTSSMVPMGNLRLGWRF